MVTRLQAQAMVEMALVRRIILSEQNYGTLHSRLLLSRW